MRGQGVGPRPILDGAAQLFDRLRRAELQHCNLELAGADGSPWIETYAVDQLFELNISPINSPAGAVSVFVDLRHELEPFRTSPVADYTRQALNCLEFLTEDDIEKQRIFLGASGKKMLVTDAPFPPPSGRSFTAAPVVLEVFDFASVKTVLVSEWSDVAWVVDRLTRASELWVSARDVLGVGDEQAIPIWSLLAAQMRRFGSQPLGEARQAYLHLIIRAAMRRSGRETQWLDRLLDRVTAIRIENLQFGLGRTTFKATLALAREAAAIRLAVRIEPDGPSLAVIATKGVYEP